MQMLDTLQSLSRRPALGMVMAFIPGIFLAESHPSWIVALLLFSFTALALLLALVASFSLRFSFLLKGIWSYGLLLLASFSAGYIANYYEWRNVERISPWGSGQIIGRIVDTPQHTERALRLPLEIVYADSLPQRSRWMLYLYAKERSNLTPPKEGDTIAVCISRPRLLHEVKLPSYRSWLRSKNCSGTLSARDSLYTIKYRGEAGSLQEKAQDLRARYLQRIDSLPLSKEEKAFVAAIALGYKSRELNEINEAFRTLGTAHLLSVSGFHLAVVCGFVFLLLRGLYRYPSLRHLPSLVIIVVAWLFATLTGFSAPTVRAATMVTLYQVALLLALPRDAINLLAFTALFLLLLHPGYLFDIGFQLSFLSLLSILLFLPFFRVPKKGKWHPLLHYLYQAIALCFSAQFLTFPLVLYHFGRVPLLFLWSNIPLVFLASLIIPLSLFIVLATPLLTYVPAVQHLVFSLLSGLLKGVSFSVNYLIPSSEVYEKTISKSELLGLYLLLFSLYFILCRVLPSSRQRPFEAMKTIPRSRFSYLAKSRKQHLEFLNNKEKSDL